MALAKPDRMSGGGGLLYHGEPKILGSMSFDEGGFREKGIYASYAFPYGLSLVIPVFLTAMNGGNVTELTPCYVLFSAMTLQKFR